MLFFSGNLKLTIISFEIKFKNHLVRDGNETRQRPPIDTGSA